VGAVTIAVGGVGRTVESVVAGQQPARELGVLEDPGVEDRGGDIEGPVTPSEYRAGALIW
jgi:hypothetical protein